MQLVFKRCLPRGRGLAEYRDGRISEELRGGPGNLSPSCLSIDSQENKAAPAPSGDPAASPAAETNTARRSRSQNGAGHGKFYLDYRLSRPPLSAYTRWALSGGPWEANCIVGNQWEP